MDVARQIASLHSTPTLKFDFFLDNIDNCLDKGKGFSLFNAHEPAIEHFLEQCTNRGLHPLVLRLSEMDQHSTDIQASKDFVVFIQDIPHSNFLAQASFIADRIIFPFWFNHTPICFFSYLGRTAYEEDQISAENLHQDFK